MAEAQGYDCAEHLTANADIGEMCKVCGQRQRNPLQASYWFTFSVKIEQILQTSKDDRKSHFKEFLKMVNALMNEGGGVVYTHCETWFLQVLDEMNEELMKLVPDNSIFSDNFESYTIDANHVAFRVKPRDNGLLSTYDFHSKVFCALGLADLTHSQYFRLMKTLTEPVEEIGINRKTGVVSVFNKNTRECDSINFRQGRKFAFRDHKSRQGEVVNVDGLHQIEGSCIGQKLLTYMFDVMKVHHYISAFTKEKTGGSFYIGLKETGFDEKDKEHIEIVGGLHNTNYVEKPVHGTRKLVQIARPQNTKTDYRTGIYICEGIRLSEEDRDYLRTHLSRKIKKSMVWTRRQPKDKPEVKLKFHPVQSHPPLSKGLKLNESNISNPGSESIELCIVEIVIEKFCGLCFYDKGPEAYKFVHSARNPTTGTYELVAVQDWFESYTDI